MNIHDINPYIRVAMPSRFPSHHLLKERIIFDYELIYLEEGSFEFGYAGTAYQCRAGDFIFIRPNIPHYFRTGSDEASQPHIHFDLNYAPDSGHVFVSFKNLPDMSPAERRLIRQDAFSNYPTNPFVSFSEPDSLLELFYEIIDPKTPLHTLRKKALMTEVINRLIQDNFPACFAEESQSLSPASQLKAYIDAGQGLQYNLDDFETQFFLQQILSGTAVQAAVWSFSYVLSAQEAHGYSKRTVGHKIGYRYRQRNRLRFHLLLQPCIQNSFWYESIRIQGQQEKTRTVNSPGLFSLFQRNIGWFLLFLRWQM